MRAKTWERFETTTYLSLMQEHPNDMIGKWFRVWCTLAASKTRWTKTATIDTWGRILGVEQRETKQFITYATMHIANLAITSKNEYGKTLYTITEEYYQSLNNKATALRRKTVSKHNVPDLNIHRDMLKEKVKNAYHFNRRTKQVTTFDKQFNIIMAEASKTFIEIDEKKKAEINKCDEILNYIKWMSTTPEWKGEGRYLVGIGTLMINKPWDYDYRPYNKPTKTAKDILVEQVENSLEGQDEKTRL